MLKMGQNSNSHQSKRLDLQGIRGIAIISVILFHFLPSIFPNGYIGVDQFFVLSGFLMCMLLRKSSSISIFQLISNFYIRRLKRILPAYFLILLFSILMVFTIFPLTAIDTNVESEKKALIFMSNRVGTDSENYFSALSMAIDVFTHTWSLSVEVQFYLLVPFLYLFGSKYLFRGKFEVFYYIFLGLISYIYSIYFLSPIVAFNSVPARIWQFLIGMISFLISNSRNSYQALNSENSHRSSPYLNSFLLIIILIGSFSQLEFPAIILRPLITILTGILMISPSKNVGNFLESRFLTYFGDISYSLYLIHWPIYAYWKLELSHGMIWNWQLLIAFGLSVLLGVISFECYEKWYLRQTDKRIFIICLVLFTLNIGYFYKEDVRDYLSPPVRITSRLDGLNESEIVSYAKAAALNSKWTQDDLKNLMIPGCEYDIPKSMWGTCNHKGVNPETGKYKIMLIGNSWAPNHLRLVHQECGHHAKKLVMYSVGSCEPLYTDSVAQKKWCTNETEEIFRQKVEKEMPDYLFIFSRFFELGGPLAPNGTKLEDDFIYKKMKTQIDKLQKIVKYKIFVMQQIANVHWQKLTEIVNTVRRNQSLVQFDEALVNTDPKFARLRYEKMASECPKCELFDYKPYFFNETTKNWRYYDEKNHGLSYVTAGFHLSFHGMELIRPVIKGVCDSIK